MKRFWFSSLAFLAGVFLIFWLTSERGVQQTQDFAVPPQPGISQSLTSANSLDDSDINEPIDGRSIAERQQRDSEVETTVSEESIVSDMPNAELDAVPLLPGIELRGDIQELHGLLENETRDESWAVPMEAELYSYFFENSPQLANNFGIPNVACRATICEVQAIGYGDGSLEAWQAATSDLDSQPWAEEFIQVELGGNQIGPDIEGLVLVLVRASGDAIVQSIGESLATI